MSAATAKADMAAGTDKTKGSSEKESQGRPRSSSQSSSGSEDIAYENGSAEKPDEPRTTKQKVDRRPPSTFHKKSFWDQTWYEKLCNMATCPPSMHELKPDDLDRGPIPTQPIYKENFFILSRGLIPLAIQYAAMKYNPDLRVPGYVAYPLYVLAFISFALAVVKRMNYYCVKYGTLDEKQIGRDRTPDKSTHHLAYGILAYMVVRTALPFAMHYDSNITPMTDFSWYYPLKLGIWEIVFDYFFYVYHRSCHEMDALWHVHQHHHTTKHPTAILSILAEDRQEYLEVFLIPLAASIVVPMSFSEHYLTLCFTIYVEMLGHSGVRAYWSHPVLTYVLKPFKAELAVEDHDIHHRFGKSGRNYGKQTRLWDRIYSTVGERIECADM